MKKASKNIENFYFNNEYIDKNPGLHQEDSKWKFSVIYPAIDKFVNKLDKRTLNILDVGGGSGQLMKLICLYISDKYGLKVNKYALDLSPGMLASQKRENENLKAALCGNICQAPFKTKKMDLTLMIDILEHVVAPEEALSEIKRISDYVIFKIPLENNLYSRIYNFLKNGVPRRQSIEKIGHLHTYSYKTVRHEIMQYTGNILQFKFSNVFAYYLKNSSKQQEVLTLDRFIFLFATQLFKISAQLSSLLTTDFGIILAKCY